jgi:hypothetical protein
LHVICVYESESGLLIALIISNCFDRAQFVNGNKDYNGDMDPQKFVLFVFRLFYTNARNARFAAAGCTSPPCITDHYPRYFAIGLHDEHAVMESNSALLEAQLEQLKAVVDGTEDVSNNAVYSLSITREDADDNFLDALLALQEK